MTDSTWGGEEAGRQFENAAHSIELAIAMLESEPQRLGLDAQALKDGDISLDYIPSIGADVSSTVDRVKAELDRALHYLWLAGGR